MNFKKLKKDVIAIIVKKRIPSHIFNSAQNEGESKRLRPIRQESRSILDDVEISNALKINKVSSLIKISTFSETASQFCKSSKVSEVMEPTPGRYYARYNYDEEEEILTATEEDMEKYEKPKHIKRNAFKKISNAIRGNAKIPEEPKFIENVLEREQAKNILLNK